jgi:nucleotide-binding universal stress UspA family protein
MKTGAVALPYKRVLVPIMGTSSDQDAIELAASIADNSKTELSLVYVVEVAQEYPLEADLPLEIEEAERALDAAGALVASIFNGNKPFVTTELLQARAAGPAIVDEAAHQHSDVIVMALRNQRKHGRATVGDTVPYVLKNASCEVLIRRQPARSGYDRCDWQPNIDEQS